MNHMDRLKQYIQIIQARYPEIKVISARFNQDGQYNDVVILNENLVFRFAKVPDAIETLRYEIAVQKSLQGQLPLRIPDPIYTLLESKTPGKAFVGYSMIPGVPLWRENYKSIQDRTVRKRLAVQLSEFLRELHQVNASETIPIQLPRYETQVAWADLCDRIKRRLYPFMREAARREVSDHFEKYLDQPDRYPYQPCLRHGDFGTGNILYDPRYLSINGIVDFGDVGLGDPAVDFAGLYISYGSDFYKDCCAVYPQMDAALGRVHFYCGTFALQEALFGIENGDQAAFQAGMAAYL